MAEGNTMKKVCVALGLLGLLGLLGVSGVTLGQENQTYESTDAVTGLNCPDPQWVCDYWGPLYSRPVGLATAACEAATCFDKTYGVEASIVAADGEGLFPRTFIARHAGTLVPVILDSCEIGKSAVKKSETKTNVSIPAGTEFCVVELDTEDNYYLWFITSSPTASCLSFVECKLP